MIFQDVKGSRVVNDPLVSGEGVEDIVPANHLKVIRHAAFAALRVFPVEAEHCAFLQGKIFTKEHLA